jgi:hypothetical protein
MLNIRYRPEYSPVVSINQSINQSTLVISPVVQPQRLLTRCRHRRQHHLTQDAATLHTTFPTTSLWKTQQEKKSTRPCPSSHDASLLSNLKPQQQITIAKATESLPAWHGPPPISDEWSRRSLISPTSPSQAGDGNCSSFAICDRDLQ